MCIYVQIYVSMYVCMSAYGYSIMLPDFAVIIAFSRFIGIWPEEQRPDTNVYFCSPLYVCIYVCMSACMYRYMQLLHNVCYNIFVASLASGRKDDNRMQMPCFGSPFYEYSYIRCMQLVHSAIKLCYICMQLHQHLVGRDADTRVGSLFYEYIMCVCMCVSACRYSIIVPSYAIVFL